MPSPTIEKMMDDIKRRLVTCVIVILYMALISISYVQYVYPAYGYMGFFL